ncbi:MAG TPA: ABC transporter family substrate-binding protein [Vicinamibacterales bacterium]|nr:ABC transporter family substrate-binding protein [Vicinamibacterales bacterium]
MTGRWLTRFAVIVASTAIAGCGGDASTESAPPAAAHASATKNQTNPTPRDQVRDGGTFTWAINDMPPNFNYNQLDGTVRSASYILEALMPVTFTNDATATPHWNPDILAAEPTVVTDPKQVVTFQINPKAIWDDGTPITWEDFYWQWRASNGTDKRYQVSGTTGFEDIESVERGKDDREVVVTFTRKFADWQSIYYLFYPASTNKDPNIFNNGWKERPLTTAGPFKLGSINQTSKTITLVRNEKWWGAPAKVESIVYRFIEPDAQIDAIANGEIDAMDIGPDVNTYNRASNIDGVEIRRAGGPNFRHITFNGTTPILRDLNVRLALAAGIDRTTITRALLGPLGVPPQPLGNHIFMANQVGYRDNSTGVARYDPDKAKTLLDEAGWKLDGRVRKKGGKTLSLRLVIPSGVAAARQESELIQNMLAQIGAEVQIDTVPVSDFFDKYVTPGQFDLTIFSWLGTPYPIGSSKSIYAKPQPAPGGGESIQQNYARIGSDALDDLFTRANGELDHAKAIEIANQADTMIWQEVHSLTLYQRPELIAVKKNLVNFGAFGFALPWVYQDIGWKK